MAKKLWRKAVGKKRLSRVIVHERRVRGMVLPTLQVDWVDPSGKRRQESLRTVAGFAVTDKKVAVEIAKAMSEELEAQQNRAALTKYLTKSDPTKTLGQLFDALFSAKTWAASTTRDQNRFRKFWTAQLGADLPLTDATPAIVERVALKAARANEWSGRTHASYLRFIKDAYTFARKKLKWIDAAHDLDGVDLPDQTGESKAYTVEEISKLLSRVEDVDPISAFVTHVAWQTGRRLGAIMALTPDDFTDLGAGEGVLQFGKATDKARKSGQAVIAERAHELARLGHFVCGHYTRKELIGLLHEAERLAGVPYIEGRAYHGIKRAVATAATDLGAMSKQSGTTRDTLTSYYVQDELGPKRALARELAGMVKMQRKTGDTV